MKKIAEIFKLGRHYKIERFSILFLTLLICLSLVSSACLYQKIKIDTENARSTAMYTTDFSLSRTNVSGTVENIYTSKDKTKTLLLLHFDDVSKVSLDASNYQIFLTACDINRSYQPLVSTPTAGLYTFGSTGYMGIYMVNSRKFQNQILDLVFRCNSEIVETVTRDDIDTQTSFDKYDQFRVFFNPAGEGAETLECLNQDTPPSLFDLYEQTISQTKEQELREQLDSDLVKMNVDLNSIEEYRERLVRDGVMIADTPYLISGDVMNKVVCDENGIPVDETDTPDTPDVVDMSDLPDGYTEQLALETSHVVARGFDFDWRAGSVKSGYLADLMGDLNVDYGQYFAQKNKEVDLIAFSVANITWRMSDGSLVEDLNTGSDDVGMYTQISNDIALLTSAWTNYYNDKVNYQTKDLKALLLLEIDLRSVEVNSTVNMSDDLLVCY